MEFPPELVTQADTPRELAEKLGIDAENFEQTIARYNQHAAQGKDPDFGSGHYPWTQRLAGDMSFDNPNVGPLDKAPYYGVKLVPVGVENGSAGGCNPHYTTSTAPFATWKVPVVLGIDL